MSSEYCRPRGGREGVAIAAIFFLLLSVACAREGLHARSRPMITRDGISIVASVTHQGETEIWRFDRQGGSAKPLTPGVDAIEPTTSSDGKTLAFVHRDRGGNEGTVWIGELSAQSYRPIGLRGDNGRSMDALPMIADDGRVLYFRSTERRHTSTFGTRWIDWTLYVEDPRTASRTRLVPESYREVFGAALCPGGGGILYGVDTADGPSVRYVAFDGGSRHPAREWKMVQYPAPLTGCGAFVAIANMGKVAATGYYGYEAVLETFDGRPWRQLTHLDSYLASPFVAPDGQTIVMLSDPDRKGRFALLEYDLRSQKARPITLTLP